MEIANEQTHRALAYISVVSKNGGQLTRAQLEKYVSRPTQRGASYTHPVTAAIASNLTALTQALGPSTKTSDGETLSDYLLRLEWASESSSGTISLTGIGRAILLELDNPRIEVSSDDPIAVVIDPKDRLAYAKVFDLLVSQPEGMLVDAYLDIQQFFDVIQIQSVRRILLSDNRLTSKRATISKSLGAIPNPPEVRFVPISQLHDRYFIGVSGEVLIFGSSLNSIAKRPGVVTPLMDPAAGRAIQGAYEAIWEGGTEIEPEQQSDF